MPVHIYYRDFTESIKRCATDWKYNPATATYTSDTINEEFTDDPFWAMEHSDEYMKRPYVATLSQPCRPATYKELCEAYDATIRDNVERNERMFRERKEEFAARAIGALDGLKAMDAQAKNVFAALKQMSRDADLLSLKVSNAESAYALASFGRQNEELEALEKKARHLPHELHKMCMAFKELVAKIETMAADGEVAITKIKMD